MNNDTSSDHIENDEIQFYYDKILQKVSLYMRNKYNSSNYLQLGQEAMYTALIMFDKYKIQFYSAVSLTYKGTQNPLNQYEYLDIASIHAIIRSCYETFLTFQYIYMQPNVIGQYEMNEFKKSLDGYIRSLQLKILLYKYEGYRQSISGFSSMPEEREKNFRISKEYKTEIQNNDIFKSLTEEQRLNILDNWKPSWNMIASKTELSKWNSKNMYNILSQYSHNAYTTLMLLDKHYRNLDEFNKDAMLSQLFEFTAIFVNDCVKLFHIDRGIFEPDEVALLTEFYTLAHAEPSDVYELMTQSSESSVNND